MKQPDPRGASDVGPPDPEVPARAPATSRKKPRRPTRDRQVVFSWLVSVVLDGRSKCLKDFGDGTIMREEVHYIAWVLQAKLLAPQYSGPAERHDVRAHLRQFHPKL